jgi:hypothetical protein
MSKKKQSKPVKTKVIKNSSTLLPVVAGIVVVAVVVLGLVWFATTPNGGSGGTPQMQVSAERIDLGKQSFETPVQASFDVKNTGTGTLVLNVPRVATLLEGC